MPNESKQRQATVGGIIGGCSTASRQSCDDIVYVLGGFKKALRVCPAVADLWPITPDFGGKKELKQ